jgi:DNA polymerase/3'-5' exonuclease PolX
MTFDHSRQLAQKIVEELAPFCAKIEVAGSIRRECRNVNDIDLVLIPKSFLTPIVDRVTQKWKQIAGIKGDARNLRFISPGGFQLDIFIAHDEIKDLVATTPTNWGSVLLCRTGSLQHNTQLCTHAHCKGLKFAPYKGVVRKIKAIRQPGIFLDGDFGEEIVASKTEEEIYEALGLKWREPREREVLKV